MEAHRIETTLTQDGTLILDNLPFHAGETVEVIVLGHVMHVTSHAPYPLRGTPVHYARPTEPVADEDWEATT
jgi:hypothetical protein